MDFVRMRAARTLLRADVDENTARRATIAITLAAMDLPYSDDDGEPEEIVTRALVRELDAARAHVARGDAARWAHRAALKEASCRAGR